VHKTAQRLSCYMNIPKVFEIIYTNCPGNVLYLTRPANVSVMFDSIRVDIDAIIARVAARQVLVEAAEALSPEKKKRRAPSDVNLGLRLVFVIRLRH